MRGFNFDKNIIIKLSYGLLVLVFIFLCFNNQKEKVTLYPTNVEIEEETKKLEVTKEDNIEQIVGINNSLSDFYLNLKGFEGDLQVTHPKVISFDKKWNGYKYWIAYTPYPKGDQAKENPHVLSSNDLINWKEKKGYKNPLDIPEDKDSRYVYNSDTHLVYNNDLDRLECYWRYVNDKEDLVIIYRRTTRDGIHWTEKEEVLKSTRSKKDYLSPTIIYVNHIYRYWYVDKDRKVKYMEYDTINKEWSKSVIIDIKYANPNLESWHLDLIKTDKGYEIVIVAFDGWKKRSKMSLYYTYSEDNINYTEAIPILSSPNNGGIYRSSILFLNNTYYIFYSEITNTYKRGVGIMYGTDIEKLNGLKIKDIGKFMQYIKVNG